MVQELNVDAIRGHIADALAWVRDVNRTEIDNEIAARGGDLRIDSKEGEAVCVLVEDVLELGELVAASDLKPEQLTTISSLTMLFESRIGDHGAGNGKDPA